MFLTFFPQPEKARRNKVNWVFLLNGTMETTYRRSYRTESSSIEDSIGDHVDVFTYTRLKLIYMIIAQKNHRGDKLPEIFHQLLNGSGARFSSHSRDRLIHSPLCNKWLNWTVAEPNRISCSSSSSIIIYWDQFGLIKNISTNWFLFLH